MDFIDQIKQFAKRVENLRENIQTEEATKTSIILPFLQLMGFDIFNPNEVVPEYTADVGIKKGEKVDYAILTDGEPVILIEAKSINEKLEKHDSQLFRYFGTSKAKFAILTNGIEFKFYTDLEQPNRMDESPFMSIDILNLKDNQIAELKKFHKSNFSIDEVLNIASELKYTTEIKRLFNEQLNNPNDEFVRLFLNDIYSGVKTQNVIDKFRPIVKKSLNQYLSETMNDKIKTALDVEISENAQVSETDENGEQEGTEEKESSNHKIVTTQEELEAYFIVKNILKDVVENPADITFKDTESYMGVLYKNNTWKWICRFILTSNQKTMIIPDENKKNVKISLADLYEIETHAEDLKKVVERYI